MQCVLELATAIGKGAWCSRQATCYICKYLDEAMKQRHTAQALSPYLLDVLVHVMLPLCFFSARAQREWEEDPTEVIRKNSSALCMFTADDLYDPRDAAMSFIMGVLKAPKHRDKLLDPFMDHVLTILVAFRAQHDQRLADGACQLLGQLCYCVGVVAYARAREAFVVSRRHSSCGWGRGSSVQGGGGGACDWGLDGTGFDKAAKVPQRARGNGHAVPAAHVCQPLPFPARQGVLAVWPVRVRGRVCAARRLAAQGAGGTL